MTKNLVDVLFCGDVYTFQYNFFPVGQGLFTSGIVTRKKRPPFQWVYDCGTERGRQKKPRRRLLRQINTLRGISDTFCPGNRHLHLACISHFDTDHISGFIDLLRYYKIGTLVIPYLTPWQRLEIALNTGATANGWFMKFLLAPAEYFISNFSDRIQRILLVGPSGDVQPPEPSDPDRPLEPVDGADDIIFETGDDLGEIEDYAPNEKGTSGVIISLLRPGGTITVPHIWEFVPYNDANYSSHATQVFKDSAVKCLNIIKKGKISDKAKELDKLKLLYESQFKSPRAKKIDGIRRNIISLFLYCGPVGKPRLVHQQEYCLRRRHLQWCTGSISCNLRSDRMGQLLTGDGYLKTSAQINALIRFYRPYLRLYHSAVLQVMHHGSRENWHAGVAMTLDPQVSIFSSNPERKRWHHPHFEVLRDFINHHPIQVDARDGWAWRGMFVFR